MKTRNVVLAVFLSMILSACSGSSNRSATEEPGIDPLSRLYKVVAQSNSVKSSDFYFNGDLYRLEACSRTECTGVGGFAITVTSPVAPLADRGFETEAEIGGVEIVRVDEGDDWTLLGGWMDHSAFFVRKFFGREDNFVVVSQSLGRRHPPDNAALPVEGSASYEGGMVGTHIMTPDRYTGRSSMTANFGETPTIDIHFTDIVNVDTGDTRADISYPGASVSDGKGIWLLVGAANYVNGEFMGPDNEEVVGVFQNVDLIGAFGAKRTE